MPSAIEVSSLAKRFGSVEALAGIDLDVPTGTVFGGWVIVPQTR